MGHAEHGAHLTVGATSDDEGDDAVDRVREAATRTARVLRVRPECSARVPSRPRCLSDLWRGAAHAIDRAVGVEWYERPGSEVDRATFALCKLRRARAGEKGGPRYGDEAVRLALEGASTPALVWLLSRAISYMDESGFPEAVEPWFPEELEPLS